jgi:hypothetical protein
VVEIGNIKSKTKHLLNLSPFTSKILICLAILPLAEVRKYRNRIISYVYIHKAPETIKRIVKWHLKSKHNISFWLISFFLA